MNYALKKPIPAILLITTLLFMILLPSFNSAYASPTIVANDPMEYGGWMDAKTLNVDVNATHMTLKHTFYGNIPNNWTFSWYSTFYLDTDQNMSTGSDWWSDWKMGVDYEINVYSRGDGSSQYAYLDKWNTTSLNFDEYWWPIGFNVLFSVGGDHLGITFPLSALGLSQSSNIYIKSNSDSEVQDYLGQNFSYVTNRHVNIVVDGKPGDWSGLSPKFTDPVEPFPLPGEFDVTSFYTTNNASTLFQRFDVANTPTTNPNLNLGIDRSTGIYYDADNNINTGYENGYLGAEYVADPYFYHYFNGDYGENYGYVQLYRWNQTTSNWGYQGYFPADWNSTFEWSIPLTNLGITAGAPIKIYTTEVYSDIWDNVPDGEGKAFFLGRPALEHFDLIFSTNNVNMIYPSENSSKPLGCLPASVSDWLSSMAVSTKLENYHEGLDTESNFVNQVTGKAVGDSGTGIVTFGGRFVNPVVKYAESDTTPLAGRAPIRFFDGGANYYFQHWNGSSITNAYVPSSIIHSSTGYNQDMFVIEVYKDGEGRYMMICYGFGWKGTYAAGKYFDTSIYPNLNLQNERWIIVKWDDSNNNGFVNNPGDGDTYTIIASGS